MSESKHRVNNGSKSPRGNEKEHPPHTHPPRHHVGLTAETSIQRYTQWLHRCLDITKYTQRTAAAEALNARNLHPKASEERMWAYIRSRHPVKMHFSLAFVLASILDANIALRPVPMRPARFDVKNVPLSLGQ